MTTTEIANQLVELCKTGQWDKAQEELYADHAVSIEPAGGPWPEKVEGLEAIKAKGDQWSASVEEVHGMEIEGPIVAGDYFTCSMKIDVTMKGMPRSLNEEICLYKVEDGKIVSEQFFFSS